MKKKLLKIGMNICIGVMWIIIFIGIYQAWGIYNYFQEYPQKEFEWSTMEGPPKDMLIKAAMINEAKINIWFGLLFGTIFYTLDYFRDRKNHFVTALIRKLGPILEKIANNLEDEK